MSKVVATAPGVMKRHRSDDYPLSHAVDGFSFAMDFLVTDRNRGRLLRMANRLDRLVVEAGGRFYFAKDLVLDGSVAARMYPPERLRAFLELKRRLDPESLLQTDLWRRLFGSAQSTGQ